VYPNGSPKSAENEGQKKERKADLDAASAPARLVRRRQRRGFRVIQLTLEPG
jgi:hypothetical protein